MEVGANLNEKLKETFDQEKVDSGISAMIKAAQDQGLNLLELESALYALHQTVRTSLAHKIGWKKVNKLR